MPSRLQCAVLTTFTVSSAVLSTVAVSAELTIRASGLAYLEAPRFVVYVGDREVGTGTLDALLSEGPGAVSNFNFSTGLLDGDLAIVFDNDAYNPETKEDRNLAVLGLAVDGVDIPLDQLTVRMGDGGGEFSPSPDSQIVELPGNRWAAVLSLAQLQPLLSPAASPPTEVVGAEATPSDPALEAVSAEAVRETPSAERKCTGEWPTPILGFLPPDQTLGPQAADTLDDVARFAKAEGCSVTVTGYASVFGPEWANITVSRARADAVVRYLRGAGLETTHLTAVGAGETEVFGSPEDNKRAVVSFHE